MFKVRVIPCLDVKDGRVVKGVNFVNLRDAGDPVERPSPMTRPAPTSSASSTSPPATRTATPSTTWCTRTAEACFMPLTVGGGVRTVEDIRKLLTCGADKVSINTAAVDAARLRQGSGGEIRRPVHRGRHRRQERVATRARKTRWEIFTHRRPQADRHRRGRLCQGGRRARRRRDPAHLHGPRRHQARLRHRAHPRGRRRGDRAGDRLRRGRHARAHGRGHPRRPRHRGAGRLDLPLRRALVREAKLYMAKAGLPMRLDA